MKKYFSFLSAVSVCLVTAIMFTACDKEHTHTLSKIGAIAATCETAGNSEYYTCDCGKFFVDAGGTTEIVENSWIIPATGHSFSSEWTYNETHHWKKAICEHTDVQCDYAEHSFIDNKCVCGYTINSDTGLEGKVFNLVNVDTEFTKITYKSGTLAFKIGNVLELTLDFTVNESGTAVMKSTAVGSYELNDGGFLFTLTGVYHDGIYEEYPEGIASVYKNLQGIVTENKIVIPAPYRSDSQSGIAYMTFELTE